MTIPEFYSHPIVIEGYGKGRTYEVIKQIREVWPDMMENKAFPYYHQPINQYYAAWLISILSKCRKVKREDVVKAIKDVSELRCGDERFIVWFGDLLGDPENVNQINNIFIFFEGDNCVHVTPNTEAGHTTTKIFQGKVPAAHIRKAAILDREFLKEIAELIHGQVMKELQEKEAEEGDGFSAPD